jgi:hypothetical protein
VPKYAIVACLFRVWLDNVYWIEIAACTGVFDKVLPSDVLNDEGRSFVTNVNLAGFRWP